jgi:hypothetical protein
MRQFLSRNAIQSIIRKSHILNSFVHTFNTPYIDIFFTKTTVYDNFARNNRENYDQQNKRLLR